MLLATFQLDLLRCWYELDWKTTYEHMQGKGSYITKVAFVGYGY